MFRITRAQISANDGTEFKLLIFAVGWFRVKHVGTWEACATMIGCSVDPMAAECDEIVVIGTEEHIPPNICSQNYKNRLLQQYLQIERCG